jgi:hypothetical protein
LSTLHRWDLWERRFIDPIDWKGLGRIAVSLVSADRYRSRPLHRVFVDDVKRTQSYRVESMASRLKFQIAPSFSPDGRLTRQQLQSTL